MDVEVVRWFIGVGLEYLLYDSFVQEVISNLSVLQPYTVSVVLKIAVQNSCT